MFERLGFWIPVIADALNLFSQCVLIPVIEDAFNLKRDYWNCESYCEITIDTLRPSLTTCDENKWCSPYNEITNLYNGYPCHVGLSKYTPPANVPSTREHVRHVIFLRPSEIPRE